MTDCPPRWATPRTPSRPTLGNRARKVADALGQPLMPWQQQVLDVALEIDPVTKRFVYREVILTVPRQSGKSTLLLVLMLVRALRERSVIRYTAQTGSDARKKLVDDWLPDLAKTRFAETYKPRLTSGHEALRFTNGSLLGLLATTKKSGHGGTVDLGIIDEAFAQPDARLEQAIKPAMITRPDPQLWIVSTAGTPADSPFLLGKVESGREIAQAGLNHSVAYFEWSAPDDADPGSPDTWRACMPALGRTQSIEAVQADYESMEGAEFARAFLNRWTQTLADPVIAAEKWASLADRTARPEGRVAFAYDVAPDRSAATVCVAGKTPDGKWFVDVVEHDTRGTGWLPARLVELWNRPDAVAVVADNYGPGASLIPELERSGVRVITTQPREMAQACGFFFDAVKDNALCHAGNPLLAEALGSATKRNLADAWAWSRRSGGAPITPVVAATLALWGASTQVSDGPNIWNLEEIVARIRAEEAATPAVPDIAEPPKPGESAKFIPITAMPVRR